VAVCRFSLRERLAGVRAHPRTQPEVMEAMHERWQLERAARAAELERLQVVRLHWGYLDKWSRAPWVDFGEPGLGQLKQESHARGVALEVVVGGAPGWENSWSRVCRCRVVQATSGAGLDIVDEDGLPVDRRLVPAPRLAGGEVEEAAHVFVH
jgi:hypothetical protein